MINDTQAFPVDHYTPSFALEKGAAAAQVMVMGPDDHIVSVMRYVLLYVSCYCTLFKQIPMTVTSGLISLENSDQLSFNFLF